MGLAGRLVFLFVSHVFDSKEILYSVGKRSILWSFSFLFWGVKDTFLHWVGSGIGLDWNGMEWTRLDLGAPFLV